MLGSTDQVAAARSVLTVTQHPNDKMLSLINHTKYSLSARGKSLSFHIDEEGKIVWGDFTENDVVSIEEKISKKDAAKDFLTEILANGSVPQTEILALAKEKEVAETTLNRAKKALGIISYSENKKWFWKLPEK